MAVPYNSITWVERELRLELEPARPSRRADVRQSDLAMAMRRTPAMRVMVATGYYDMLSTPASAENQIRARAVSRPNASSCAATNPGTCSISATPPRASPTTCGR